MCDILSNLFIGIVSGGISGVVVTWFFSRKEKKDQWEFDFNNDKQSMSRYLELLRFEVSLIREKLVSGEKFELDHIKIRLKDVPRRPSFKSKVLTEESLNLIGSVNKSINNLTKYIDSNTLKAGELRYLEGQLLRAQLEILSVKKK